MRKRETPFSAFEKLTRALTAVPKAEIDERAREYDRERKKKKQRKRKRV